MICGCTIVRAPDGNVLLYGPGREASSLSVSPAVRKEIVEMALAAVGIDQHVTIAA